MGRFYDVDEYASSSGGFLEIIIPILLFAYAFLFWGSSARLRLTVFIVIWFGLTAYGISIGDTLGVLLVVFSLFIALWITEPISCFIDEFILGKHKPEMELTEADPPQVPSNNTLGTTKKSEPPKATNNNENNSINELIDPVAAYDIGFEDRLNSKQMYTFPGQEVTQLVRENYELGYNNACCYIADLLNIKNNAVSELDLFLTLLHAFETNLVSEQILASLVNIFDDAVRQYQHSNDYEDDLNQQDEINFVIREIETLINHRT